MVQTWMRQVKGKGTASDPTPEASRPGGGNPPPPPGRKGAGTPGGGGGGHSDAKGEGSGKTPNERGKGKRDERPAPQPENDYDGENDKQFNLFSRVVANPLGQRTRVPAEPSTLFRNEKCEDIRMWLLISTDYFARNG